MYHDQSPFSRSKRYNNSNPRPKPVISTEDQRRDSALVSRLITSDDRTIDGLHALRRGDMNNRELNDFIGYILEKVGGPLPAHQVKTLTFLKIYPDSGRKVIILVVANKANIGRVVGKNGHHASCIRRIFQEAGVHDVKFFK